MNKVKAAYKDYKLYKQIQLDSLELSIQLKRNMVNFSNSGEEMFIKRNSDLVMNYLK
jgi:hypothetical protein